MPALAHAPQEDERVSIYLRIIEGPRFHERLLLGAKDGKDRRDRITEWRKRIMRTIRRGGEAVENLVRTYDVENLFVSFRIALTPYARRKESPQPTTIFTGFFGDPERIPSYRGLRDTCDAAGTIFWRALLGVPCRSGGIRAPELLLEVSSDSIDGQREDDGSPRVAFPARIA